MDCSQPDSSVHGISQVRILEWLPFSSAGDLPEAGIEPTSPKLAGRFFNTELPGLKALPDKLLITRKEKSSIQQLTQETVEHLVIM